VDELIFACWLFPLDLRAFDAIWSSKDRAKSTPTTEDD
jgi:hypothetical protein